RVQPWSPALWQGLLLSPLRASDAPLPPMTPRITAFRRLALLVLVVAITATTGCARMKGMFKDKDEHEGVPVAELYDKGHRQMRGGNWNAAVPSFRRLVAQYPYGAYTEQALMETAYAQYKMGDNEEAISTID